MLLSLSIRNYALISQLDVAFQPGLNMITGETGAGKSILLGALSLLLGARADSQVLKDKSQKCLVEGAFDLSGVEVESLFLQNDLDFESPAILRREINALGKSRAFINDTPVTLPILRELGSRLVDIHSQHQSLMLNDPAFALHVVDQYGKLESQVKQFRTAFESYRELGSRLHQLEARLNRARADQDYLEFQLAQLDEVRLEASEQEQLEQEQVILEHAGEIHGQLNLATEVLHESEESVLAALKQVLAGLQSVSTYYPDVEEPLGRLQIAYIELQELARELASMQDHVEADPERLQQIVDRLDTLNGLEKKHQVSTVGELISLRDSFRDKLSLIQTSDDEIVGLKMELDHQTAHLQQLSKSLSESRLKVIPEFEKQVSALLKDLGMPNGRFEIHQEKLKDFSMDGVDEVRFFFSANKNQTAEELSMVASGGETSRLMLSVKSLISNTLAIPTVIFDEIDSGVSGDIADKVGNLIVSLSKGRQILNITHLPQVASKGDYHYKVYKYDDSETTHTTIKLLSEEERVHELAQMLSGEKITSEAIQNARVLLKKQA